MYFQSQTCGVQCAAAVRRELFAPPPRLTWFLFGLRTWFYENVVLKTRNSTFCDWLYHAGLILWGRPRNWGSASERRALVRAVYVSLLPPSPLRPTPAHFKYGPDWARNMGIWTLHAFYVAHSKNRHQQSDRPWCEFIPSPLLFSLFQRIFQLSKLYSRVLEMESDKINMFDGGFV